MRADCVRGMRCRVERDSIGSERRSRVQGRNMHWKRRQPKWPFLVSLVCLFVITLVAPWSWQHPRAVLGDLDPSPAPDAATTSQRAPANEPEPLPPTPGCRRSPGRAPGAVARRADGHRGRLRRRRRAAHRLHRTRGADRPRNDRTASNHRRSDGRPSRRRPRPASPQSQRAHPQRRRARVDGPLDVQRRVAREGARRADASPRTRPPS